MVSNKLLNTVNVLSALCSVADFCANCITIADFFAVNKHEKRVQIGLDNITKALAFLNRNISRSMVSPEIGSSPDNIELIHSNVEIPESDTIVLEGQTLPSISNFELTQESLRRISVAITKIMSKTVDNPDLLRFETNETQTKNADNLQTVSFSANVGEMQVNLTDLINQLKLDVGGQEYTFSQVLYNLLKVSQDANFKSDNLPDSLLAVASEAKELKARLIGV